MDITGNSQEISSKSLVENPFSRVNEYFSTGNCSFRSSESMISNPDQSFFREFPGDFQWKIDINTYFPG